MSKRSLSPRAADRILDAPGRSDLPVAWALEALRARGTTDELRREDAAVSTFHAAFRAARLAPAPSARDAVLPLPGRSAVARAVAAAGLVMALTSGGFALAASGHLPALPGGASGGVVDDVVDRSSYHSNDHSTDHSADRVSEPAAEQARRRAARTDSPTPTTGSPSGSSTDHTSNGTTSPGTPPSSAPVPPVPTTSASAPGTSPASGTGQNPASAPSDEPSPGAATAPAPRLESLCTAFQAGDGAARAKALESPAFSALVAAAGGQGAVATYCVDLVGVPTSGQPAPGSTASGASTPPPASAGQPATVPSPVPPSSAPTTPTPPAGQPSTAPSSDAGQPAPGRH